MADGPQSGRVPPHDLTAERAVIGGILLMNEALNTVTELPLEAAHFYKDAHALIYEAMIELFAANQPVDSVTLRERLVTANKLPRVGGDEYLHALTDTIPTVANIEAHAKIVIEKALVRRVIHASHEIAATGYGDYGVLAEYLDQSERAIFDVAKERMRNRAEPIEKVVMRTFEEIEAAAKRKDHITGLPSGFRHLDALTAGFHPGDLVICAGRPGMGKTAFALNLAINACRARQAAVAVFSLEMPNEQLTRRLLCSEAGIDGNRMRTGRLTREDWPALAKAAGELSNLPIWMDDTPAISVLELRAKARRLRVDHNLALVVVDYLQLMRSGTKTDSREQEISEISRSLKALAKELRIPVMALSQLNRGVETRGTKDKRPQLSDLRESGAIEQDADTILFIYRDELYNPDSPDKGIAEIIIGKQRAGPTGTVKALFRRELTRFENLDEHHDGSEQYQS